MKSDVRADVKNNGGTDMSKVQDAPKMMTAMKKINAMYKTEKYHETKPGSIHDAVAQMQMNEQKIVSIKVKEFTKMVETYLLKGGVIDTTSVNEDVDLNEEINALHLNELREFITTYNKWFATNHRAEEFILQVDEGIKVSGGIPIRSPGRGAGASNSAIKKTKPLMQDVSPGADNSRRGDAPKKVGTIAKIAKGINKLISPMKNLYKGKGYKFDD